METGSKPGARTALQRILIFESGGVLAHLLASENDFALCNSRLLSTRTRQSLVQHRPNLVLLDLSQREKEGLRLIREIRSTDKKTSILVISTHASQANHALRAGADGYISADENSEELAFAIRDVLAGHRYFSEATPAARRNSTRITPITPQSSLLANARN